MIATTGSQKQQAEKHSYNPAKSGKSYKVYRVSSIQYKYVAEYVCWNLAQREFGSEGEAATDSASVLSPSDLSLTLESPGTSRLPGCITEGVSEVDVEFRFEAAV